MTDKLSIKAWRAVRNMTQKQLADAVGVTQVTISKWEGDPSIMQIESALKLCEVFNTTIDMIDFSCPKVS